MTTCFCSSIYMLEWNHVSHVPIFPKAWNRTDHESEAQYIFIFLIKKNFTFIHTYVKHKCSLFAYSFSLSSPLPSSHIHTIIYKQNAYAYIVFVNVLQKYNCHLKHFLPLAFLAQNYLSEIYQVKFYRTFRFFLIAV